MEASLGWIVITGYAIVQNIVFFFLFLTQKTAHWLIRFILASISLCCALILVEDFLGASYGYTQFPHMIMVSSPLWFLLAPLLYIYIRTQIKGVGLSRFDWFHLLPFLFVLTTSLEFYSFSAEAKLRYLEQFTSGQFTAPVHNLNYQIFFFQAIAYLIASYWQYRSTECPPKIQNWQKLCLLGLFTFSSLGLIGLFSINVHDQVMLHITADLYVIWLALFNLGLLIRSIRYPKQIFFKPTVPKHDRISTSFQTTMKAIIAYMDSEKPYRDPNYNIHQLANYLGHSKNHLEQSIKHSTQLNFREYLNSYRIEEAKIKLKLPENQQYTIQSIAEEVGFKSSATFYRVFKKQEGITPKALMTTTLTEKP